MTLVTTIQKAILALIKNKYDLSAEQLSSIKIELNLDKPKEFGDFACNAAMALTKELKIAPRAIAQEIQKIVQADKMLGEHVSSVDIAGPGFINIHLKLETWQTIAQEIFENPEDSFKFDKAKKRKKYLLEFVSANPTGPLHLGHGRGGIIGDVLANVLEFVGHTVAREFYINDAGSQIVKLGVSLKTRCQQELGRDVEFPDDGYAGKYVVELAKKCIEHYGKNVVDNDDDFFAEYAKGELLELSKQTLDAYGIQFDRWFSEKQLHTSGAIEEAIELLRKKELVYEKDDATWFKSTEFGDDKDRVIRKADGSLTYIAADIAYHKDKFERGYDTLIDIMGQDHHGYVMRLKATMIALGYGAQPPMTDKALEVILYQLVSIKQGGEQVKMSKRAGTFEQLSDVIEKVGVDVARFFYLNRKADAHLEFDLDVALKKTEENPVFYIQYAYVRTNSLLAKAGLAKAKLAAESCAIDQAQVDVIKKICSLKGLLQTIATNRQTHLLSYYTLELARTFHAYYATNKIIDPEKLDQTKSRLFLTKLMQNTLGLCLDLLGLSKPKTM